MPVAAGSVAEKIWQLNMAVCKKSKINLTYMFDITRTFLLRFAFMKCINDIYQYECNIHLAQCADVYM